MFLSIINKSSPSSTVFPLLDPEGLSKRTKYTNDQINKAKNYVACIRSPDLPSKYCEIKMKICKSKVHEITVKLLGSPKM